MPILIIQPETILSEDKASYKPTTTTTTANGQSGLVDSATGAAGALAGWAIASLGKQMSNSDAHSTLSAAPASSLAPPTSSYAPSSASSPNASPRPSTDDSWGLPSTPKPPSINVKKAAPRPVASSSSGMRLGGTKPKTAAPNLADVLADEWHDADEGVETAWGNDDLIDVNADTDDWAAFESAPIPEVAVAPPQSYYVKPPTQTNGTVRPSPPKAARVAPAKVAPTLAPVVPATIPKPSPKPAQTPSLASNDGWGDIDDSRSGAASPAPSASNVASLAGMSKDEKDKEMARRREERKAVRRLVVIMGVADDTAYSSNERPKEGQGLARSSILRYFHHRCHLCIVLVLSKSSVNQTRNKIR